MWKAILLIFCFAIGFQFSQGQVQPGSGQNDLVNYLPGLRYWHTYKQYAGYLDATEGNSYFYWFIESQNDQQSSKDPIIVWLSSYPGCSSLLGLLSGMGPFRPNLDGYSLYENVFSWNKVANLLFIDSPAGVGWSVNNNTRAGIPNDDQLTNYNFAALRDFIYNKFPGYLNNDLYLAGEAYGGVLIPLLAKKIADAALAKPNPTFPNILKGIAVGNGVLSAKQQFNFMINFIYFHGFIGTDTWDDLLRNCGCSDISSEICNFYNFFMTNPNGDCGKPVKAVLDSVTNTTTDATNIYRDCYGAPPPLKKSYYDAEGYLDSVPNNYFPPTSPKKFDKAASMKSAPWAAYDPAHSMNYDSTDALLGFSCWGDKAKYLSQKSVMQALHVTSPTLISKNFTSCLDIQYNRTYLEMDDVVKYLIRNTSVKILLYSGDVDLEYNFLGQEWFIDRHLAKDPSISSQMKVVENRGPWTYRGQTAGFVKRYSNPLDEVIVKGAGRYVPMDRAGPALQMIYNFIKSQPYSTATNINVTPKPNGSNALFTIPFTTLWTQLILLFIGYVISRS